MYGWSLIFFVMASLAAILGFGGPAASASAGIAKLLCFFFLLMLYGSLLGEAMARPARRRRYASMM